MKTNLKKIMAMLSIAIVLMTACSKNPIDQALDNYETVIMKLEKKNADGLNITLNDVMQMQQEAMKGVDLNSLMKSSQPNEKQMQRAMELAMRMQKLTGL